MATVDSIKVLAYQKEYTKISNKYIDTKYIDTPVFVAGSGNYSIVAANDTGNEASGDYSYAEGSGTYATGNNAHAEGDGTGADGNYSHAEGYGTYAGGNYSHVEGNGSVASGESSHAEGELTRASGLWSHAEGYYTKASGQYQHVSGKFNVEDLNNTYAEIVGIGTHNNSHKNGRTLDWSGNEQLAGSLTLGLGTTDEVTITAA